VRCGLVMRGRNVSRADENEDGVYDSGSNSDHSDSGFYIQFV